MKTFHLLLLLSFLPYIAWAQSVGRTVKLVGIVSYEIPLAILQVPKTNCLGQPEQFTLGTNQSDNGVEIQNIDVSRGIVTAKVDGEPRILAFDESDSSKTAGKPPTIRLHDLNLQPLVNLYIDAKGRTILEHPELERTGFTFTANPQSKSEAAKALEEFFASRKIAAIPDGEKFIMLVPYAFTNEVSPHSDKVPEEGPNLPRLSLNFQGVPLPVLLKVYGEYTSGRPVKNLQDLRNPCNPSFFVYLVQENSLSKGQICYAMDTTIAWRHIRLVPNSDNTISWEKIP